VNAAITAMLDLRINGLLAVLLTTFFVVIFGEILPMAYLRKYGLEVTAKLAPIINKLIMVLSPIARPMGNMLDKLLGDEEPSIYTKEELYKILEEHKVSEFSDIEEDEVQIVKHALGFGDKHVREIMTPRKVVVSVSADELIGPVMIDELHKSGFSRFPVYNDKQAQNFIGTLYLRDLINRKESVLAKEAMRTEIYYVHEEESLAHALKVFLKTNHHLLVVVNTFEEFVGVISFEDVVEQIIGKQVMDEFDKHADLRAVAQSLADKEKKQRQRSISQNEKNKIKNDTITSDE
jgi:metal transporter CNNM